MGLTLITGLSNVGRSGDLYRGVRAEASRGETPVVLFPTAPDARRAAREFATEGIGGVRTAVLDRWIAELWSVWGDGRRMIDQAQRVSLVGEALARTHLRLTERSARHHGFTHAVCLLARQVLDPAALTCGSGYDSEVRDILSTYAKLLEHHLLVEPAKAALILAAEPPTVLPPLYLNRFTDLGPTQEAVVRSFSRVTDVSVVLPWKQGHGATTALEGLVHRLASEGEHLHVEEGVPRNELELLGASLFDGERPVTSTGMVRMGELPGAGAEVTAAMDVAIDAIESGVEPSRIVITFRGASGRSDPIIAAAGEAGVPLYVDLRIPVASTPLGRALSALLDVATGTDGSRERLGAYLQSAYSGVTADHAARIDRQLRRGRGSAAAALWDVEGLEQGAGRVVRAARVLGEARTPDPRMWKELVDSLVANAFATRTGHPELDRLDAAAHSCLVGVVNSMRQLGVGAGVPAVRTVVEHESVHFVSGDESAGVHFTEAGRVRATRYDLVILGGLNATEFSSERDPSWEAGFLERVGEGAEAEERARERLLFYSLVTRARTGLVLLRSTGEAEGKETRPSLFWNEVADRYREGASEETPLPDALRISAAGDRRRPLSAAVAYTPGRRRERGAVGGQARPTRATALEGEVLEKLSAVDEYSASEIEAYLGCPRRWFYSYVLGPREIDTELGLREWGSAAHDILARFYRRWVVDLGRGRITPGSLEHALELFEDVSAEAFASYPPTAGAEEEHGAQTVRKRVRRVIEDDVRYLPGFEPVEVELAFGSRHDRIVEFGGVRVRGSVDRIDAGGASLVVTDYKSGATVKGHGRFAADGLVQLPVYAAAAATVLGRRAVGAVYRSLATRSARGYWLSGAVDLCEWGTRTDGVDEKGMSLVIEEAEERVSAAVKAMRSGQVEPRPGDACRYCGAEAVCDGGGGR